MNPPRVKKLGEQRGIGPAHNIWTRRIDEHDLRAARSGAGQGGERQPELVHRTQPVWAHENWCGPQSGDQIARIETFTQRTEQAARAFDDNIREMFLEGADVRGGFGERDASLVLACSEQRREGAADVPGIDLIKGNYMACCRLQRPGVVAIAGANGFEGGYAAALNMKLAGE